MIGVVRVKESVLFSRPCPYCVGTSCLVCKGTKILNLAPGGIEILSAIRTTARHLGRDLTVTSGVDGEHSGPTDPHHEGNALDVRSHDFEDRFKPVVLNAFLSILPQEQFYCFLENPNLPTEHFHLQVRKGTTYP